VKSSKRQHEAVAATPDGAAAAADSVHVRLAANCTIRDCSTLKADLSAVLAEPASVSIDVSALERIDTAAIQLLCAFVRDRKGRQLGVTFSGKSAALTEAARLLGVDAVLDIHGTVSQS
jgi:ABC-type transporter Mla MlaB component